MMWDTDTTLYYYKSITNNDPGISIKYYSITNVCSPILRIINQFIITRDQA